MEKIFRTRISVLLIIFIFVPMLLVPILMLYYNLYGRFIIFSVVSALIIFSFTGYRCLIIGDKLYLKVWFITIGSANIVHIISVERTYNLISSPAASFKRLCIRFRSGVKYINWLTWQCAPHWIVSPVREHEFIKELKAINPDIYVHIPDEKGKWGIGDWDI